MPDVYFCRTRYHYDGYEDFFTLVTLSGYPSCFVDEIDAASDNTYIFTPLNGEVSNGWKDPKAHIIAWDLEWRVKEGGHAWTDAELNIPRGVSRVWASDRWYADHIRAEYVPLGSHAGLVQSAPVASEDWQVTLQGYLVHRRRLLLDELTEQGISLAPSVWNPERDSILKRVTALLHIHQWDAVQTVAPLRFAIAAAYGLPLISEQVEDRSLFDNVVLFCQYNQLVDYTRVLVTRHTELLKEHGAALHNLLCVENSFRSFVEAAL